MAENSWSEVKEMVGTISQCAEHFGLGKYLTLEEALFMLRRGAFRLPVQGQPCQILSCERLDNDGDDRLFRVVTEVIHMGKKAG